MSRQDINIGTGYDTLDGDKLRDGGDKINKNFIELYRRAVIWQAQIYDVRTTVIGGDGLYILASTVQLPFSSTNFSTELTNGDWVQVGGTAGDMQRSVYDTNGNDIVDNAERLGGQLPSFYAIETEVQNRLDQKEDLIGPKGTAFNKNFGIGAGQVAEGNHNHDGIYEPVIGTKNTAFNQDYGTTAGTVAMGNHNHDGVYEPANGNIQAHIADLSIHLSGDERAAINAANGPNGTNAFATMADLGTAGYGDMLKADYDTDNNGRVDEADNSFLFGGEQPSFYATALQLSDGLATKEDAFNKNTGFNLNLGTASGTVSEGDHLHTGVYQPFNTNIQEHIADNGIHVSFLERGALDNTNNPNAGNPFATIADLSGLSFGDMLVADYGGSDGNTVRNSDNLGGIPSSGYGTIVGNNVWQDGATFETGALFKAFLSFEANSADGSYHTINGQLDRMQFYVNDGTGVGNNVLKVLPSGPASIDSHILTKGDADGLYVKTDDQSNVAIIKQGQGRAATDNEKLSWNEPGLNATDLATHDGTLASGNSGTTGENSFQIGKTNLVESFAGTALGSLNVLRPGAENGLAMGFDNIIEGWASMGIGYLVRIGEGDEGVNGTISLAAGYDLTQDGYCSAMYGLNSEMNPQANYSFSAGVQNSVREFASVTLGMGLQITNGAVPGRVAVGSANSDAAGAMFTVGNGAMTVSDPDYLNWTVDSRSNALQVFQSGFVLAESMDMANYSAAQPKALTTYEQVQAMVAAGGVLPPNIAFTDVQNDFTATLNRFHNRLQITSEGTGDSIIGWLDNNEAQQLSMWYDNQTDENYINSLKNFRIEGTRTYLNATARVEVASRLLVKGDPLSGVGGDEYVGNRAYNDARYQGAGAAAAIIKLDEGNGDGFGVAGEDRTYKAPLGNYALDLSFGDTFGPNSPNYGASGGSSFALGYNNTASGYGSVAIGAMGIASGTYAFVLGEDSKATAYQSWAFGPWVESEANYGVVMGHTNKDNKGGGNFMFGRALSNTISKVDATIFLGHCNIEPAEYSPGNDLILVVGNGETSGAGDVPFGRVAPSDAFRVWRSGKLQAPDMTIAEIDTWADPKTLITKEWAEAKFSGGTPTDPVGIIGVDEGGGIGFVRSTDDRTDKGTVGVSALDLSAIGPPTVLTAPFGAIGDVSFAMGYDNIASGYGAFAMGEENLSSGTHSFTTGVYNEATNYANFAVGGRNKLSGFYSTALGISNWDEGEISFMMGMALRADGSKETTIVGRSNVTPSTYLTGERVNFIVGTGTTQGDITTSPDGATPLVQQDGLRVFEGGLVTAPSQTSALINANQDSLITKAYFDANSGGGVPSKIAMVDNIGGLTDNVFTMNGVSFMHNYTSGASPVYLKNLFFGEGTGNFSLTADVNVAFGNESLYSLTTGWENHAFGNETLASLTTGQFNTAFGSASGYALVDGIRNSFFGRQSGVWLTTGDNNTFFGSTSGFSQVGGGNLTEIDQATLVGSFINGTQGSTNETVIGYQANGSGSNTVTLGNASITAIKAGVDYTAVEDRDLITKGYADANYSGGGGTIGGSIALNQIAHGSGTNAIKGDTGFTFDGASVVGPAFYEGAVSAVASGQAANDLADMQQQLNLANAEIANLTAIINNFENRLIALENA